MLETKLNNSVRNHRDRLGLSQQALAERVGVTRQAILAIEAGRQAPSTVLSLHLAKVFGCSVENLFQLQQPAGLEVLIPGPEPSAGLNAMASPQTAARLAVGRVRGSWVGHPIAVGHTTAADAVVASGPIESEGRLRAVVQPLADVGQLGQNILAAGCAPLLGLVSDRLGRRFHDARLTWLPANSQRALDLLEAGLVHIAGVHIAGPNSAEENKAAVRQRFGAEPMLIVNLTRWRQGLVFPAGNPLGIEKAEDLLRPGLRVAAREPGAGANQLFRRLLDEIRAPQRSLPGPLADGHEDVARRIRWGAADVGVAIEGVALAFGLGFKPLSEERFDLVVSAAVADSPPVSRLIDLLADMAFRAEVTHLPGYDGSISGHITTLGSA